MKHKSPQSTKKSDSSLKEKKMGNDMGEQPRCDVKLNFLKAIKQFNTEEDVAKFIKEAFEQKYHGTWHCIVGKNYGSAVSYDKSTHFSQQFGPFLVELWRCDANN